MFYAITTHPPLRTEHKVRLNRIRRLSRRFFLFPNYYYGNCETKAERTEMPCVNRVRNSVLLIRTARHSLPLAHRWSSVPCEHFITCYFYPLLVLCSSVEFLCGSWVRWLFGVGWGYFTINIILSSLSSIDIVIVVVINTGTMVE